MQKESAKIREPKSGCMLHLKDLLRSGSLKKLATPIALVAAISLQLSSFTSCAYNTTAIQKSTNWAGYVAQKSTGSINQVQGSFTVPKITSGCDAYMSAPKSIRMPPKVAIWVGIGGDSEKSLVQIGIVATYGEVIYHEIRGFGKSMFEESTLPIATYYGFYEALPRDSVKIPGLAIYPGDTMFASVAKVSGSKSSFILTLTDLSRKEKSFTMNLAVPTGDGYGTPHLSAEWIVEKVSTGISYNSRQYPMAGFGEVQFNNSKFATSGAHGGRLAEKSAADGNIVSSYLRGTDMLGKGYDIASPTPLGQGGEGFDVLDSECTPSGS